MQAVHGSLERRSPECFNIVVLMKVVINRTHPVVVFLQALSRAYIYNERTRDHSQRLRGQGLARAYIYNVQLGNGFQFPRPQGLARAYIYNEWGLRAGVLTEQTLMRARV